MRYETPELIEQLAAEYVLGTLTGLARNRFRRLARERKDVRDAVWRWESRLGCLSSVATTITPPDAAWTAIERRLWPDIARGGLWNSLRLWRSWSMLATAVLLIVTLWLVPAPMPPQGPGFVGIIGQGSDPLWLISANLDTGELEARAVNAGAAEVDKVFELWMLPTSGAPISIGLLPVSGGSVSKVLPPGLAALLKQSRGLAVSVEPIGGSPTGLPTGPVIHTTNIVEL